MLRRGLDLVFRGPWWDSSFLISHSPALESQTLWGRPAWQTGLCCLGRMPGLREVLGPVQTAPASSWGRHSTNRPRCWHPPRWAYHPCTARGPGRWGRSHYHTDCSSGPPAQLPAQHPGIRQVPGSSHTVPQVPWWWISTRPSHLLPAAGQPRHGQIYGSPEPGGLEKLPSLLKWEDSPARESTPVCGCFAYIHGEWHAQKKEKDCFSVSEI